MGLFRIQLHQPSPVWNGIELRNIQVRSKVDTPVFKTTASTNNANVILSPLDQVTSLMSSIISLRSQLLDSRHKKSEDVDGLKSMEASIVDLKIRK